MITVLKENSVATLFESIPFDRKRDVNIGVESYSIYQNKGIKFSLVEYRVPETQILQRYQPALIQERLPCSTLNDGQLRRCSITVKVI
jgi:hypothetical protein